MSVQPYYPTASKSGDLQKAGFLQQIGQDILATFRSVQLAIVLLSLLAISTIIGVVMPQVSMVEVQKIQAEYGANYNFLNTLGLFNVYYSFWFMTLEVLFFFNLLIGSFKWLRPAYIAATEKITYSAERLASNTESFSFAGLVQAPVESVSDRVEGVLKRFRYKVIRTAKGELYACKGNLSRFGPHISHLGILLCLIASVYGAFTGFKAVHMISPGNAFTIGHAEKFTTNTPKPYWLGSVPKWQIYVKKFWIEYYEDHPETPKQYYSILQVRSPQGKVLKEQTISVNHPLEYDNITVYQASFAPSGRFLITVNGQPQVVENNTTFNDRPISVNKLDADHALIMFPFFKGQDPGIEQNSAFFFIRGLHDPPNNGRMPENMRLAQGETGQLKGTTISYIAPEMSTGLQIKKAPEVPLTYLSYLIIMTGAVLCFFSQRRIWVGVHEVAPGQSEVVLYPKTNKARHSFKTELFAMQEALAQALQPQKSEPSEKETQP